MLGKVQFLSGMRGGLVVLTVLLVHELLELRLVALSRGRGCVMELQRACAGGAQAEDCWLSSARYKRALDWFTP